MTDDILSKVEKTINTTGYPLELYISSILKKHDQITQHNEYFFDFESNNSRSVDLVTSAFGAYTFGNRVGFRSDLVIECKKSPSTAWVFFENDWITQLNYSGQIIDYNQILFGNYNSENKLWNYEDIMLHYGTKGFTKIAHNYQVVRTGEKNLDDSIGKTKTKDTIFEAINQVLKFIEYEISNIEKNSMHNWQEKGINAFFAVFYPIIVYDGPLYNGYLQDNSIKLEKRDHIILETQYKPRHSRSQKFYIDVVKKEKFEDLLTILEKEKDKIACHIDKYKEKFSEEVTSKIIPNWRLKQIFQS